MRYLLLFAALFAGSAALAYTFIPTEAQWAAWPDYCRAKYVTTLVSGDSTFQKRIAPAEIAAQEARMGPDAWYWLHHYCAGIAMMAEAQLADPEKAKYLRGQARIEMQGMYERVPPSDPFFGEVVTNIARLDRDEGKPTDAMELLQEGMSAQPAFPSTYTMAALIHKDASQLKKAVDVLMKGDEATKGQSAEIHYFLGLLLIDVGDLDSAVAHARKAYELGYPLPGLKAKLRRHNRSID